MSWYIKLIAERGMARENITARTDLPDALKAYILATIAGDGYSAYNGVDIEGNGHHNPGDASSLGNGKISVLPVEILFPLPVAPVPNKILQPSDLPANGENTATADSHFKNVEHPPEVALESQKVLPPKLVAFVVALFCFSAVMFSCTGCISANPDATPEKIASAQANGLPVPQTYVVSSGISNLQTQVTASLPVVSGILAATPAAPVVPLLPTLLAAVFGVTTLISGYIAKQKSDSATAHSNAAATMASMIVSGSAAPANIAATMTAAGAAGTAGIVAEHIAAAQKPI